ncbi:hypothetical protein [Metabacillus fastidiosus]|uniref:hypothetical protein n=1 Tax=Metabacillus fastidiosus TaxID=1458 RepID=UPI002DBC41F2|nr:hypothetical protein [Metabacillus fastidiosus]MEC2075317.1 hypothetical protein [Metabacillus fastidiosus]
MSKRLLTIALLSIGLLAIGVLGVAALGANNTKSDQKVENSKYSETIEEPEGTSSNNKILAPVTDENGNTRYEEIDRDELLKNAVPTEP